MSPWRQPWDAAAGVCEAGVSIAFTVICILLLVAVPIGFYMLTA